MIKKIRGATGAAALLMVGLTTTAYALPLGPRPTLFSTAAPITAGTAADIFTPGDAGVTPDAANAPAGLTPQIAIHEGAGGGFATNGLGLLPGIQVDAFSRGDDLDRQVPTGIHGVGPDQFYTWLFSVDFLATGKSGHVATEAAGAGAGGDVFQSMIDVSAGLGVSNITPGLNEIGYDADGTVGLGLGLTEGVDDLDAVDISYFAHPEDQDLAGPNYFSVDAASALAMAVSPADVLVSTGGTVAGSPYASASALGLDDADELDALALAENGDGTYTAPTAVFGWADASSDMLVFSLAPGSPSLGTTDALRGLLMEPGDVLTYISGVGVGILVPAEDLGLLTFRTDGVTADNLNALDVVPEPATVVMSLMALFAVGFVGWRKRREA